MKIAIAQINTLTGDIEKNFKRITELSKKYENVLIHPLSLTGGEIGRLKENKDFKKQIDAYIKTIAENNKKIPVPYYFNATPWTKNKKTTFSGKKGIHLNLVGGYEDKIYEGSSFIIDQNGKKIYELASFKEEIAVIDFDNGQFTSIPENEKQSPKAKEEKLFTALTLALRDYVKKSGFEKVVIGLSGGMDSAFVAVLASEALGGNNVHCLLMPSQYTSEMSNNLAIELCQNFSIQYDIIPIAKIFEQTSCSLIPALKSERSDTTFENLQARIRGMLLMSVSNRNDEMLLATGNKSELLTGYTTLYGDTCGGFNPIKDLYKSEIYQTAKWYNKTHKSKIPEKIITRPPTAELKLNQKDSDNLPPYPTLDGILRLFIEKNMSIEEITSHGYDKNIVKKVFKLLESSEYKRRQLATGPIITRNSIYANPFPIINRFTLI